MEGDELVAQGADFAVEDQAFEVEVRAAEERQAGGFVAAAGLEADEPVFDNIDAADAVAAGDGVGGEEELQRVGDGFGGVVVFGVRVGEFGGEAF